MKSKIEVQNDYFDKLISLNLPPIQSRFIAFQFSQKCIENFELEYSNEVLKIVTDKQVYSIEINKIDIPTNGIF